MERPLGFRLWRRQPRRNFPFLAILGAITLVVSIHTRTAVAENDPAGELDRNLVRILKDAGFTGRIETTLEARLGRPIDLALADLGRLLFFDKILGLHNDNSCAGCHSPAFGFGDSQPMAIGVDSNDVVGPGRFGPRNQRRSPMVANTIFYPALMWTPRFVALSGDPFDPSLGFKFPPPENIVTGEPTLLAAQGSLPSTELVEMAGFTGITANPGPFGPRHFQFDDGHGEALPAPDGTGFHNFPIQAAVDARLNAVPEYLERFAAVFNAGVPLPPGGITISMRRRAIAEFQTILTAADAPLDRFARGNLHAMSPAQKRGALLFFGKANCVACHGVAGNSNEMFSDFKAHRIGGPQLAPAFGVGTGNTIFDGPDENEDFGFAQTEGDSGLRYMFRTAPLRNLKVAPAFFHNGAFGTLEAAIAHHLDVEASLRRYEPAANAVPPDLVPGPSAGILAAGIDQLLKDPIRLTRQEFLDLVDFVRDGLFDRRVRDFCQHLPVSVPSGIPLQLFERCKTGKD
ncbi:MAG: cytochrome-c peroxidase [bacterium]